MPWYPKSDIWVSHYQLVGRFGGLLQRWSSHPFFKVVVRAVKELRILGLGRASQGHSVFLKG